MNRILENMCESLDISYEYIKNHDGKEKIVYGTLWKSTQISRINL